MLNEYYNRATTISTLSCVTIVPLLGELRCVADGADARERRVGREDGEELGGRCSAAPAAAPEPEYYARDEREENDPSNDASRNRTGGRLGLGRGLGVIILLIAVSLLALCADYKRGTGRG